MAKKDSFEESLQALEKIVEKLENGGLALEDALKLFQEGREHAKRCAQKLNDVERKIQLLLEDEKGRPVLRDFESADGSDESDRPDEPDESDKSAEEDDFPG